MHALWTLEGLHALDHNLLLKISESAFPERIQAAIQLSSKVGDYLEVKPIFQNAFDKNNNKIDLSLAMNAVKTGEKSFVILEEVLDRHFNDTIFIEAALSNLTGFEKQFHYFLTVVRGKENNYPILSYLKEIIQKSEAPVNEKEFSLSIDTKTSGLKLYRQHCASCHGEGGQGNKNLAPPIYNSNYIKGDPEKLILLVLHGLQGPVHVNGKRYELSAVMPGLKDNKDLSNQDIANILSFVRNAFSNEHQDIQAEEVKRGRGKLPKGLMYTEEELGIKWKKNNGNFFNIFVFSKKYSLLFTTLLIVNLCVNPCIIRENSCQILPNIC